jgi:FkbM family methyltransferase
MKSLLKRLANHFGYDILHLPTDPSVRRRMDLYKRFGINLVFDIGANTGQYAHSIRKLGYTGRIVSFEPLPDAYSKLQDNTLSDSEWTAVNTAIGNTIGKTVIHVAQNSYSSSILDILPRHVESAADSMYVDQITVPVKTLDSLFNDYFKPGDHPLLKIDTQGFERQVIEGATESLPKVIGLQLELSLVPLYQGETLMQEMLNLLREKGFVLMSIEPGHQDYTTGEILQVEALFFKNPL